MKLNYGKYRIPDTLKRIITLQKDLDQAGLLPYGDLLGYYFALEGLDSRYLNTPLDVIAFARPGVDGIHYGFLTDFGSVEDLETAYIVRVSPMDFDEPVKIVARNIHDFIVLLCHTPITLDLIDLGISEGDYKKLIKEHLQLSEIELDKNKQLIKIIQEKLQLKPIPDIYAYLQRVKNKRNQEITLHTVDGIGVVYKKTVKRKPQFMELTTNQSLKLEEVQRFFNTASLESKLRFLRDAQSNGLIYDNAEVKQYLKEHLLMINLKDEAERLSYP